MAFAPVSKKEKKVAVIVKLFLVGASIIKGAQLLQSLVFFSFFFKDRLEATNVKIKVQLLITVLNYWTGKRGAHLG